MSDKERSIPPHVTAALKEKVTPALQAWFVSEGLQVADLDYFSVQPVNNMRDWVLKVHLTDERVRVFPMRFPVMH